MDTTTLDQLNESEVDMILGIESGSVVVENIYDEVVPTYGLEQELVVSSTDGMLAEVENRYRNREEFALVSSPWWSPGPRTGRTSGTTSGTWRTRTTLLAN